MKTTLIAALVTASFAVQAADPAPAASYKGLGAASISKETLNQFRAKPLDSLLSRQVQAALDVRAPSGGVLSPDGKSLFFTWRVTGISQVWRIDGPQRFPVQMTGGEDATSLHDITPDGKWLIVSRDRKGEENPGLYLQDPAGGALIEIQHKPNVQTNFGFVSDDSRWVYFLANDEKADSYTAYRYDIANKKIERLFGEQGYWEIADHQPDGRILMKKQFSNVAAEFHEWNPKAGKLTPLIGVGEQESYMVQYGTKPGEFFVQTNKLGEFHRLYQWTPGGTLKPFTADIKWDVESFGLDAKRERLYYSVNEGGYSKSYALDAKTLKPLALPAFKDALHVGFGSSSRDGRYAIMGVMHANAPSTSYVLDWKSGKLTQWVLPSSPEIDTRRFAVPKLEYYPARDGTQIPMFVRRPAKCEPAPCPVVVDFHGGPEAQSEANFSPYAQLFVDAGFIFVEPNVRGSSGYGKSWLDSDNGPKRLNVVTDIEDAALYIRKNWTANGKAPRIGVMGGSYGGYATMAAMTMFAGSYDAGVASVGISNFLTFLENTAPYRRAIRVAEYGDPVKDREALIKLSPITYLDKLKDPLLIIQGASDPRVPVGEAVQMYEAAQKKGVESGLIIFADEGHGAAKRENRVLSIGHTIQFFNKHLKK